MRGYIALGLAAILGLAPAAASAAGTSGHPAVALAALVGSYSPGLTATQKSVLAEYLGSNSQAQPRAVITVTAATVTCGTGDVDITRAFCDLTFGAATHHLAGRAANELYATLVEAGVQGQGAAGTYYEGLTDLKCVLTPSEIAQNSGGGASCTYTPS
jgi:hypothetical protein